LSIAEPRAGVRAAAVDAKRTRRHDPNDGDPLTAIRSGLGLTLAASSMTIGGVHDVE
jgi:hypothetical protein